MANKLSEMIDRIVNERIEAMMAEMTGQGASSPKLDVNVLDDDGAAPPTTGKRARQTPRRFATKVAYAAVPIRANAAAGAKLARQKTIKALTPALAEVWNVISKNGPISARDVNGKLADRSNKSIQSAVHQLRTLGLIASQPLGDE